MKFTIISFFLVTLTLTLPAQQTERDLFSSGENRFRNQEYELANRAYDRFLEQYPSSPFGSEARFHKAISLFYLERYDESLDIITRLQNQHPNEDRLSQLVFWQGIVEEALGNLSNAKSALETYLQFPQDPLVSVLEAEKDALRALSQIYISLGELELARTLLETYLDPATSPQDATKLWFLYIGVLIQESQWDLAFEANQPMNNEELGSSYVARYHFFQGEILQGMGKSQEAVSEYQYIIENASLSPREFLAPSFLRLFTLFRASGQQTELQNLIRRAELELASERALLLEFWSRLGVDSFQNGELDLAELYLKKVWDLRTEFQPQAYVARYLANVLWEQGEQNQAIIILNQYEDLLGQFNLEVSLSLAEFFIQLERYSDLETVLSSINQYWEEEDPENNPEQYLKTIYLNAFYKHTSGNSREAYTVLARAKEFGIRGKEAKQLWRLSSLVSLRLRNFRQAEEDLLNFLVLENDSVEAQFDLLRAQLELKKFSSVIEKIEELKTITPYSSGKNLHTLMYYGGISALGMDNRAQALDYFTAITRPSSGGDHWYEQVYPLVLYYRGWIHYQEGRDRSAVAQFLELFSSEGGEQIKSRAAYLAAWASFRLQNYVQAEQYLNDVPNYRTDDQLLVESRFLLGKVLRARSLYDSAQSTFQSLYRNNPNSDLADDAYYEYAETLVLRNEYSQAQQTFENLANRWPSSSLAPFSLYRRGELFFDEENWSGARDAFQLLRQRFPRHGLVDDALFWMAESTVNLGETGGGILFLSRIIDEYPDSLYRSEAMRRSAELYSGLNQFDRAIELYSDLILEYPNAASSTNAQTRLQELRLTQGGYSQEEASLWVLVDRNNEANTTAGRRAILQLARLIFVEQGITGQFETRLRTLLEDVSNKSSEAADQAAQAEYFLGELYWIRSDLSNAARWFLRSAGTYPIDRDSSARALYRAAEAYKAQGNTSGLSAIKEQMDQLYPESSWNEALVELLEEVSR